jgi:hypothetical protein
MPWEKHANPCFAMRYPRTPNALVFRHRPRMKPKSGHGYPAVRRKARTAG